MGWGQSATHAVGLLSHLAKLLDSRIDTKLMSLIPHPKQIRHGAGQFDLPVLLTLGLDLAAPQAAIKDWLDRFANRSWLAKADVGFEPTEESSSASVLLKTKPELAPESYELVIESHGIQVLAGGDDFSSCLLYTSPSPRDATLSRMPSSA